MNTLLGEESDISGLQAMLSTLLSTVRGVEVLTVVTLPAAPNDIIAEPILRSAAARRSYHAITSHVQGLLETQTSSAFVVEIEGSTWHGLVGRVKEEEKRVVGGVVFARREPSWSEYEINLLGALTTMASTVATRVAREGALVHQAKLDKLVTAVADRLMTTTNENQKESLDWVVQTLGEFFGADVTLIRRNDYDREMSVLVAEWPVFPTGEGGVHPFSENRFDSDPIFAATRDLKKPWFSEGVDSEDYLDKVEEMVGATMAAGAMVPLMVKGETWGVMGFIHFGLYAWTLEDINALTSVASLVSQLQGRFEAEHDASHDSLTGLYNRRALLEALDDRLARGEETAVMMLDLDRFKVMNDYLGHTYGDQILITMADRLQFSTRPEDFAARLGGDEFIFVMAGPAGALEASALAHRMLNLIAAPVVLSGQTVMHTTSIGVAFSDESSTSQSLLHAADVAMYCAKEKGRNQVVLYDDDLAGFVKERSQMEILLSDALRLGQLRLHYQPEVDLSSGRLLALEALVRWEHPTKGLIDAAEFIPLAEETGVVREIGKWVLAVACAQMAKWRLDCPDLIVRVNLSLADLKIDDFVEYVQECLTDSGLPSFALCIEITEHVMVKEFTYSARVLDDLRALGITVAIDDFGTGFASMTELKNLPVDFLKLDMSFVQGITTDRYDHAIVESIIRLASALDLGVIAEGVENHDVAAELRAMGCTRAQGYLFSRPGPAEEFERMLACGITALKE